MPEEEPDAELTSIARELYAHVPAEFIAARNARVAQLKQAGDKALAARVKALPKATAAAWAVGMVAREEPGELDALGELGAELRVAQAAARPAELRALGKRRRQLTSAVTRAAARLAEEHDVELSAAAQEQVEVTWHAVVIHPDAERAVRSLLLVRTLDPGDPAGITEALAVDGVVAAGASDDDSPPAPAPPRPRKPAPARTTRTADDESPALRTRAIGRRNVDEEAPAPSTRAIGRRKVDDDGKAASSGTRRSTDRDHATSPPRRVRGRDSDESPPAAGGDTARERRRVERQLRARERVVEQAQADLEETQEELSRVEAEVLRVAARVEELRRELEEREDELAKLDEERSVAQEEREDAEERAQSAVRAVEEVREQLAELSD